MDLFSAVLGGAVLAGAFGYTLRVRKQKRIAEKLMTHDKSWYATTYPDFALAYGFRCWKCGLNRLGRRAVFVDDFRRKMPIPDVEEVACKSCDTGLYYAWSDVVKHMSH